MTAKASSERVRCRNQRCRSKLPIPTANEHKALAAPMIVAVIGASPSMAPLDRAFADLAAPVVELAVAIRSAEGPFGAILKPLATTLAWCAMSKEVPILRALKVPTKAVEPPPGYRSPGHRSTPSI